MKNFYTLQRMIYFEIDQVNNQNNDNLFKKNIFYYHHHHNNNLKLNYLGW